MTKRSSIRPETAGAMFRVLCLAKSAAGNIASAWDRFWFTPRLPDTLSLMRIGTGRHAAIHAPCTCHGLVSFVGESAWINNDTARQLHDARSGRRLVVDLPVVHQQPVVVVDAPGAGDRRDDGLHDRTPDACHGSPGVGVAVDVPAPTDRSHCSGWTRSLPTHDVFDVGTLRGEIQRRCVAARKAIGRNRFKTLDEMAISRRATERRGEHRDAVVPDSSVRDLSVRRTCKARGTSWWDGTAMWYAIANYEYQSMNLTWLGSFRVFPRCPMSRCSGKRFIARWLAQGDAADRPGDRRCCARRDRDVHGDDHVRGDDDHRERDLR